ncbi:unnamed protein product, partial [Heterotrigona itama]
MKYEQLPIARISLYSTSRLRSRMRSNRSYSLWMKHGLKSSERTRISYMQATPQVDTSGLVAWLPWFVKRMLLRMGQAEISPTAYQLEAL